METHSTILPWEIPWSEEPGRQQSMGSQKSWTQQICILAFGSPDLLVFGSLSNQWPASVFILTYAKSKSLE